MKQSAGILVYKYVGTDLHVLLVHLGGPIWGHQDAWSVPKGELDAGEDHIVAAKREFEEELGSPPPDGELYDLGTMTQTGKINYIWAVEGDFDLATFHCNTFRMEWPRGSGRYEDFPENDRAEWFDMATARKKLFSYQTVFLDRLEARFS